jgi:hypothetical protein
MAVGQLEAGGKAPAPWEGGEIPLVAPGEALEIMMVGIEGPGIVLVSQPGEVFGETGVRLRRELRQAGVRHPFVVGYTNGWRAYLPPARAFPEGGYEVSWAQRLGVPETLQDEIRVAVIDAVRSRAQVTGRR